MDDNTAKASQQEDVSDSALDRAANEGVTDETVTENPPVEDHSADESSSEDHSTEKPSEQAPPVVPPDNAERSRLGRRLSQMESKFSELVEKLENYTQRNSTNDDPFESSGDVFDMPTTPEELERFIEKREAKKQQTVTKYETNYLTTLDKVRVDDEDEHNAIMAEMLSNFNIKHSDNAALDAKLNYADAERAMLRKKMASPAPRKVPLKGETPKGTGVNHGAKVEMKQAKKIELDQYASEFVSKTGMSEESVNKSLSGNAPNYLRK